MDLPRYPFSCSPTNEEEAVIVKEEEIILSDDDDDLLHTMMKIDSPSRHEEVGVAVGDSMCYMEEEVHNSYSFNTIGSNNLYSGPQDDYQDTKKMSGKRFFCLVCSKSFSRASILEKHSVLHSTSTYKTLVCPYCSRTFAQTRNLSYHVAWHVRVGHDMDEGFSRRMAQNNDRAIEADGVAHEIMRPPWNERAGTSKSDGGMLLKKEESSLPSYPDIGPDSAPHKDTNIEIIVPKKNPLSCPTCHKSFSTGGSLSVHAVVHDPTRRLNCHLCPRSFTQKATLRRHVLSSHFPEQKMKKFSPSSMYNLVSRMRNMGSDHQNN